MSKTYRVLTEMRYLDKPDEVRAMKLHVEQEYHWHYAKVGEVVNDIPPEAIKWLLKDGIIEALDEPVAKAAVKEKKGKEVTDG